jgi:hypothetical protein
MDSAVSAEPSAWVGSPPTVHAVRRRTTVNPETLMKRDVLGAPCAACLDEATLAVTVSMSVY